MQQEGAPVASFTQVCANEQHEEDPDLSSTTQFSVRVEQQDDPHFSRPASALQSMHAGAPANVRQLVPCGQQTLLLLHVSRPAGQHPSVVKQSSPLLQQVTESQANVPGAQQVPWPLLRQVLPLSQQASLPHDCGQQNELDGMRHANSHPTSTPMQSAMKMVSQIGAKNNKAEHAGIAASMQPTPTVTHAVSQMMHAADAAGFSD
jgi:hypothetical protein